MANYHLLGRKVENCLLGLFDDPDRPRSPDHGEKISKSFVVFYYPQLLKYSYFNYPLTVYMVGVAVYLKVLTVWGPLKPAQAKDQRSQYID